MFNETFQADNNTGKLPLHWIRFLAIARVPHLNRCTQFHHEGTVWIHGFPDKRDRSEQSSPVLEPRLVADSFCHYP